MNTALTRSARRRLQRVAVDGLFWCYRQIRLAQKTGDAALLREALTARKEYLRQFSRRRK